MEEDVRTHYSFEKGYGKYWFATRLTADTSRGVSVILGHTVRAMPRVDKQA